MKSAPGRRRSIRYSMFIGVLAGSVFSGSGAFAVEDITSVEQLLGVTPGTSYVLKNDLDLATADVDSATEGIHLADDVTPGSSSYISNTFSGTVDDDDVFGWTP